MHYKFDIKLTDHDYYEFNKCYIQHAPETKKLLRIFDWILPVISVIAIIRSVIMGYEWTVIGIMAAFLTVVCLAAMLFMKAFTLFNLKVLLKIQIKKGKIAYSENSTLEFGDESFTETTEEHKSEIKYSADYKIYEYDGRAIYIMISSAAGYIIPLSLFESDEEKNEFLEFIHKKTNK